MNIIIKATGAELTDESREFVTEKLRALEKLTEHGTTSAELECEIEQSLAVERAGAKYRAEGTLVAGGALFRAEATGETLEAAVDRVRDELSRELRRARGKERGLLKRGGAALKRMLRFGN